MIYIAVDSVHSQYIISHIGSNPRSRYFVTRLNNVDSFSWKRNPSAAFPVYLSQRYRRETCTFDRQLVWSLYFLNVYIFNIAKTRRLDRRLERVPCDTIVEVPLEQSPADGCVAHRPGNRSVGDINVVLEGTRSFVGGTLCAMLLFDAWTFICTKHYMANV